MIKKNNAISLKDYLNERISKGYRWFIVDELREAVSLTNASLNNALYRLSKQKKIKIIKRGFGIILPIEGGELHPTYFIDPMMKYLGVEYYYVGLLSASAHWGASHQASMVYQVISNKVISPIKFQRGRIDFIKKSTLVLDEWIERVPAIGGYTLISSPELTAIDLVKFSSRSGYLNNVATLLSELAELWGAKKMKKICKDPAVPTVTLQRLGYILDCILELEKESGYVAQALKSRKMGRQPLQPSAKTQKNNLFNKKWSIYINTSVEPD